MKFRYPRQVILLLLAMLTTANGLLSIWLSIICIAESPDAYHMQMARNLVYIAVAQLGALGLFHLLFVGHRWIGFKTRSLAALVATAVVLASAAYNLVAIDHSY